MINERRADPVGGRRPVPQFESTPQPMVTSAGIATIQRTQGRPNRVWGSCTPTTEPLIHGMKSETSKTTVIQRIGPFAIALQPSQRSLVGWGQ